MSDSFVVVDLQTAYVVKQKVGKVGECAHLKAHLSNEHRVFSTLPDKLTYVRSYSFNLCQAEK